MSSGKGYFVAVAAESRRICRKHTSGWPRQRRGRSPSKPCGECRTLRDRAFGIEFRCDIGTTDQMRRDAACGECRMQGAVRFLPSADDDGIDFEHPWLVADAQVQAVVIDALIRDAAEHRHALRS